MSKLNSNEDLVHDLLNYSPYGALGQMFVMECIRKHAEKVAHCKMPPSEPDAMFSNETWQAVAKNVHERCEAFYNRKD